MRDVSLCPEEWWRDFRLWSKEESLETAEWGPVNERYQETAFNSIEMGHWTTRIISKRKELSFQEVSSPSLEVIKQREITAKQTCHGWSRYRLSGWCTGSLQTLCPLGRWNQWLLEVLGGVYLTWETIFPTCHWGERGSSLSLSLSLWRAAGCLWGWPDVLFLYCVFKNKNCESHRRNVMPPLNSSSVFQPLSLDNLHVSPLPPFLASPFSLSLFFPALSPL